MDNAARKATMLVYIQTKNDVNGNPRRGWLVMSEEGNAVGFVEEGYAGWGALRRHPELTGVPETGRFDLTPSVYRQWVKGSGRYESPGSGE